MKWKYLDTGRHVRSEKTLRTVTSRDEKVVRFKTIDRLPIELQAKINISSTSQVPSKNIEPYVNFYDSIFKDKDYVYVENVSKNYSFFNIKVINNLFKKLNIKDNNYSAYLKSNNSPLVIKYKSYYYIIKPIKYENISLADMLESGMISMC